MAKFVRVTRQLPIGVVIGNSGRTSFLDRFIGDEFTRMTRTQSIGTERTESTLPLTLTLECPEEAVPELVKALRGMLEELS